MDTTSYRMLSSSKCSLSVDAYIMTMRMMQLRNASFLVPFPASSSHHLDYGQFHFSLKIGGWGGGGGEECKTSECVSMIVNMMCKRGLCRHRHLPLTACNVTLTVMLALLLVLHS